MDHHHHQGVKGYEIKDLLNTSLDLSKFTEEEKWRIEHIRMHEKHKGHEAMHAEMVLVLITALLLGQVVLVFWRKHHPRSYQIVTLIGMWVIPFVLCIRNRWWRFIFFWLLYTCITLMIGFKAMKKPLDGTTPRLVYKWFLLLYKVSYGLGIVGYTIMMATFLGFNLMFHVKPHVWMDVGIMFLFYGLYYGVLGRDCAEICADKMAAHIGYYKPDGMPTRSLDPDVCAVCGNKLLVLNNDQAVLEKTYRLTCQHVFHEFCIRGWCIVGKKQICPYCKEKVDLKRMLANPWEKPHVLYGQLLDWIRWLVAWQPIIIMGVQGVNYLLGLE
ncbi:RING finger protein 121-like isoform X1 [Amphibalanus amphitrite]|uniref:RING finger protein 121-like isoform X1 n=2 Tax=Amphibalanus amphitrite TaxID=1232801 RepID=UPI001C8FE752|nr:RING finger protein 121-like isoform X1 [Amphibalanus amphitrite]